MNTTFVALDGILIQRPRFCCLTKTFLELNTVTVGHGKALPLNQTVNLYT